MSALPLTQLADWDAEKFGAMSGWVSSTPVSMTPTVTFRLPGLICAARSAPMARRSHWSASSGSSPAAAPAASRARSARDSTCAAPSSVVPAALSGAVRVAPAESTPRTARIRAPKSGFGEWTTMTPIRS